MDIIYSEDHRKRASKTELYGGELLPPLNARNAWTSSSIHQGDRDRDNHAATGFRP